MNLLEELTRLADKLDKKGLFNEASVIDEIIKKAAETPQQAYQNLNQEMKNTMVSTMLDELQSAGPAMAKYTPYVAQMRDKTKGFLDARNFMQQIVEKNPQMRGAFNAALTEVNPKMNDLVALRQQVQQSAQPEKMVDMYSKYEDRFKKDDIAGKGRRKYERIDKQLQRNYNSWLNSAKSVDVDISKFPPMLKVDGIKGPATQKAFKAFPELEKQYKDAVEKRKKQTPSKVQAPPQTLPYDPRKGRDTGAQQYDSQLKALENAYRAKYNKPSGGKVEEKLKERMGAGDDAMTASEYVSRFFGGL